MHLEALMPNQTTQLASGLIKNHDRLTAELVEPSDLPAAVLLSWPQKAIDHHTGRVRQRGRSGDAGVGGGSSRC